MVLILFLREIVAHISYAGRKSKANNYCADGHIGRKGVVDSVLLGIHQDREQRKRKKRNTLDQNIANCIPKTSFDCIVALLL